MWMKPVAKKAPIRKVVKKAPVRKSAGGVANDVGVTPPLGLFDPLGFLSRGPEAYRRYQEIEVCRCGLRSSDPSLCVRALWPRRNLHLRRSSTAVCQWLRPLASL